MFSERSINIPSKFKTQTYTGGTENDLVNIQLEIYFFNLSIFLTLSFIMEKRNL